MSKILFLDAGHGAGDPGAVGNGTTEEKMTIKIVDALERQAKRYGVKVEKYPHNKNSYADKYYSNFKDKNKQVLEVHLNAASSSAHGTEVLLHSNFNINDADAIDKALLNASAKHFTNRGFKFQSLRNADYCRINGVGYRLLEICFITNVSDMKHLNANIEKYAEDIIKGIYKEFGGKAPQPTKKTVHQFINKYGNAHYFEYNSKRASYVKGEKFRYQNAEQYIVTFKGTEYCYRDKNLTDKSGTFKKGDMVNSNYSHKI